MPDLPAFLYGTAWKEDQTARLTFLALEQGFRAIDTANQRKHYHEAAVGEALQRAFQEGLVGRDELFLQTKFTHRGGQDHRLPYDPTARPAQQVRQSLESSLKHLGVSRLDSFVLHGPTYRTGLAPEDWTVWRAMELLQEAGFTTHLGVSNVSLEQLQSLCEQARVPPRFVQNRCYARLGWDRQVRAFCRQHQLRYQGFSLLTANRSELESPQVAALARRLGCTRAQLVFAFASQVGMIPLTGTSQAEHMRQDLQALGLQLSEADLQALETVGES